MDRRFEGMLAFDQGDRYLMRYYRCKCGRTESFGSMPPARCFGCKECRTRPALAGVEPWALEPHNYVTEMVETDAGEAPLTRCRWCGRSKRFIEGVEDPPVALEAISHRMGTYDE